MSVAALPPALVAAPLFVPAFEERKLAKAEALAEAVIVDLEDATADARKAEARDWVAALPRGARAKRWVRINAVETGLAAADLAAAAPVAARIVLPKCRGAADLDLAASALEAAGTDARLMAIVETAEGLEALPAIARAGRGRLVRLSLGLGDLSLDMGVAWDPAGPLAAHARALVAFASRAAGLAKPIDSVVPRVDDEAALVEDCVRARASGFGGKFCIHPRQIDPVAVAFRPGEKELELDRRKVEAFAAAEAEGRAAVVVDGWFVDYPVAVLSEQRLASVGRATGLVAAHLGTAHPGGARPGGALPGGALPGGSS